MTDRRMSEGKGDGEKDVKNGKQMTEDGRMDGQL